MGSNYSARPVGAPGVVAGTLRHGAVRISLKGWTIAAAMLAVAGLFTRIMSFPLRHDEQMYLPVGALLGKGDLYRDYGFNNLPNLPLLLDLVYRVTGTEHYLLAGRLVVFAAWLLAAAALALIAWRATASAAVTALLVVLLVTNPVLLGPAGTLVTNNFMPVPFALLALHLFIAGIDRQRPHWPDLVASGFCLAVAAGFKANYIFLLPPFAVAALALPLDRAFASRLTTVALPLLLGAIVGALPVLYYFSVDPQGFVAHVLNYHRGPHIAYWLAHADLDGPKIFSMAGKLQLAWSIWLEGAGALLAVAMLATAMTGTLRRPRPGWPIALTVALVVGAVLVSFVPTPAFPQYYIAPIPFGLALVALLYGRLDPARLGALRPMLVAVAVVAVLIGVPRLFGDLANAGRPGHWTGNQVKAAGRQVAAALAPGDTGRIATLAPLFALEAGREVYPELATGPLVYRVGDLIPAADRRHYRMVSPTTVTGLLAADPPAAILTGFEGELDAPFIAYAVQHGYRPVTLSGLQGRYGDGTLYVRPRHG